VNISNRSKARFPQSRAGVSPALVGEADGTASLALTRSRGRRDARPTFWVALAVLAFSFYLHAAPKGQLPTIAFGTNGHLIYDADERGNRVPDFSHCGYVGGDRQIPDAPVRVVIASVKGDETAQIQKAIDYVAGLPADANGNRGAALLLKGRHEVLGSLQITNSGVVLRGQGMGEDGTVLVAAGLDRRTLIRIVGRNDHSTHANESWQIKDDYVPVGANGFHLKNAAGLKVGDTINVIRPSTKEWIHQLGANEFGGGIGGGWKPGSRDLVWDRVITAIDGDLVTVNAPITTAMEAEFGGGHVESYAWPGRVSNAGIENLRLESTFDANNPKDENHSWCAITMENTADAWVRQVTFKHFAGSAVAIYESCKQITVKDCLSLEPVSEDGGYRRHTFFTMGQQTLFLRCYAEHGRHDFSVGHCAAGPNAFVQCEASLPLSDSGAIESWASGTLFDNVRVDGNGLSLANRGANGQDAGWAAANSVFWNCSAAFIHCANPPTAQNWAFGSWAEFEGDGIWRSSNDFMSPDSLFAAQLKERLGADTAAKLKLMPHPHEESSNPPVDKAQELAAASHQPAPLLADYIADAAKRDLIPNEPGNAKRVEEIGAPSTASARTHVEMNHAETVLGAPAKPLLITNGWITCDGKLLIGDGMSVAWWRGNVRPSEASSFEAALTRFVPGRVGKGFTDDLDELADAMQARGQVALDHHYGLWYERRRDDHERVRRMTGDVWPPFYEQPFARSGQGTAWDGLSKYDLTKFNPWYWSRLKEFAGICDERGLVLFNENYFQHNIIEAGAHWADCPWRSANNINNTGFPEPPPYAGDKRIFQAELFYDVTHPVRRKLHESYIRQCLDNFTNTANVIQFTSAEFTGPKHFVEFWLDTIGEWERETGRKQIVALAAPKDVQDAILADATRSALVDVICFRYWWVTDKGTYAPNGGLNLAPRQFQRQWRGGAPSDLNLAAMAAEYRAKFPSKPVIAASEQGADLSHCGWAYVCAGGSIPNLPRTMDAKLLAAIPRMTTWAEASGKNRWALREAGRQMLIYPGADGYLDLSKESGSFRVNVVNSKTGEVTAEETMKAGSKMKLPNATVVWLLKE
jgi:Family of unknown function (DUF6298)